MFRIAPFHPVCYLPQDELVTRTTYDSGLISAYGFGASIISMIFPGQYLGIVVVWGIASYFTSLSSFSQQVDITLTEKSDNHFFPPCSSAANHVVDNHPNNRAKSKISINRLLLFLTPKLLYEPPIQLTTLFATLRMAISKYCPFTDEEAGDLDLHTAETERHLARVPRQASFHPVWKGLYNQIMALASDPLILTEDGWYPALLQAIEDFRYSSPTEEYLHLRIKHDSQVAANDDILPTLSGALSRWKSERLKSNLPLLAANLLSIRPSPNMCQLPSDMIFMENNQPDVTSIVSDEHVPTAKAKNNRKPKDKRQAMTTRNIKAFIPPNADGLTILKAAQHNFNEKRTALSDMVEKANGSRPYIPMRLSVGAMPRTIGQITVSYKYLYVELAEGLAKLLFHNSPVYYITVAYGKGNVRLAFRENKWQPNRMLQYNGNLPRGLSALQVIRQLDSVTANAKLIPRAYSKHALFVEFAIANDEERNTESIWVNIAYDIEEEDATKLERILAPKKELYRIAFTNAFVSVRPKFKETKLLKSDFDYLAFFNDQEEQTVNMQQGGIEEASSSNNESDCESGAHNQLNQAA